MRLAYVIFMFVRVADKSDPIMTNETYSMKNSLYPVLIRTKGIPELDNLKGKGVFDNGRRRYEKWKDFLGMFLLRISNPQTVILLSSKGVNCPSRWSVCISCTICTSFGSSLMI